MPRCTTDVAFASPSTAPTAFWATAAFGRASLTSLAAAPSTSAWGSCSRLDDNGGTIHGRTELSFVEDVAKSYEAYGGQVLTAQDSNKDVDAIRKTIAAI